MENGDNIIEFTPTETGTFTYSCWMGIIKSKIYVVNPGAEPETSATVEGKQFKQTKIIKFLLMK